MKFAHTLSGDYVAIHFNLQLFADTVVPSNAETNMMTFAVDGQPGGGLDGAFQKANDQKFLEIHKEALVFEQYVGSVNLPANSGNTVRFPKKNRVTPKNTRLTEGKTPDPNKITMSFITATVEQHGDYFMFSDVALGTSIYDLMAISREGQAYESAEIKNALIRDDILADEEIQTAYAENNGTPATGAAQITPNHKLTVDLVRKRVADMKRNNIRPAVGKDYVLFIHPDQWYDLTSDPAWEDMHKYSDPTPMLDGEIGRISGCRFVETTTVLVTKDGASDAGVYHSIMLGADAIDQVKLANGGVSTIAKGLGSGGTADPLNQRATVGWKMFYGAKVKDPLAVIELMTGSYNSANVKATDLVTSDWE